MHGGMGSRGLGATFLVGFLKVVRHQGLVIAVGGSPALRLHILRRGGDPTPLQPQQLLACSHRLQNICDFATFLDITLKALLTRLKATSMAAAYCLTACPAPAASPYLQPERVS